MSFARTCTALAWLLAGWFPLAAQELSMSAEDYYQQVRRNPNLKVEGRVTGEDFCWHAAYAADGFVDGYLAYGDLAWLDWGQRYFDWLEGLMETAPDGYRGWIGPYIYGEQVWCDVHVGDAILASPMLRFAEAVLGDPALAARYGERARAYVDLARRDLVEKWDARGTWREDGEGGAYVSWDHYLEPGKLDAWRKLEADKSTLSLPYNKQMDVGLIALRLYRLTGEEQFRERARRIFWQFKSRLQYFDDHYVWNYWEPQGPWDLDEAGKVRHWVNVHPHRNYQAREVAFVAEAYHTGVVFDQVDLERILRTNLEVMWNGDRAEPQWRNADGRGPWQPGPEDGAGTLWTALGDFSQTVRDLQALQLREGGLGQAYFQRVVLRRPPGFARKHATHAPDLLVFPFSECRELTLAAALPRAMRAGAPAALICKARVSGDLAVALYTAQGELKRVLFRGQVEGGLDGLEGFSVVRWDGKDPEGREEYTGRYQVRWTLGGEYREVEIEIE
jgi:hypothetical protein